MADKHIKQKALLFYIITIFGFALLYIPLGRLIIFSFNDSRRNIIWKGFTTKYYHKAFYNDEIRDAFINSLLIASFTSVITLIIGTMAAIALWRFRFTFKFLYDGIIHMPLVIPEICLGVAMLIFFYAINLNVLEWVWPLNLLNILCGHVLLCLPFVVIIIRARLNTYNRDLEEASRDLGASELQTLYLILLPFLRPSMIVAALVTFTVSLDDFVITFFLSGPDTITLPVKIFSMTRFGVSPEINVISTVLMLLTIFILTCAALLHTKKDNNNDK